MSDTSITPNASIIPIDFAQFITDAFIDPLTGVRHMVLHFPNGFGASIILGYGTYGLELAILHGEHIYTTDTDDGIRGWLNPSELAAILTDIITFQAVSNV